MTVHASCAFSFSLAFLGGGVGRSVGRWPVAYVVGIVLAAEASVRLLGGGVGVCECVCLCVVRVMYVSLRMFVCLYFFIIC